MNHNAQPPQNTPQGTYSALSVANYVLTNAKEPISNLKLQKMLYFIQGFALVRLGHPLFDDEIQAWTYGPVIPSVYQEYMHYGSNNITGTEPAEIITNPTIKSLLDGLIRSMERFSGADLVRMTHLPDTPWSTIWENGRGRFARIPLPLIRDYFERKTQQSNA